jgi:hypothetical protein
MLIRYAPINLVDAAIRAAVEGLYNCSAAPEANKGSHYGERH